MSLIFPDGSRTINYTPGLWEQESERFWEQSKNKEKAWQQYKANPNKRNPILEKAIKKAKNGFGGGTKQGGINAPGFGSRIGMDPDLGVTMDWQDSDGDGVDDRNQRAPGTPYVGWDEAKASDKTKFGRQGRGRKSFNPYQNIGSEPSRSSAKRQGSTGRNSIPKSIDEGWTTKGKGSTGGGFTFDGHWTGQGDIPTSPEGMQPLISSAPASSSGSKTGQRIDSGDMTMAEARQLGGGFGGFIGALGGVTQSGFGGTTKQGGVTTLPHSVGSGSNEGNIPSDFGEYDPATFAGNMYNQGWGNMVDWGNKFKDNKAIQGFISGSRLDANQTMMNMGMDLLYQKGQMSQMADYHGGMENLKTGNTLKLLSAEGGIVRDLMWDQGDIESRQIGERGDQDRRTVRATGQENRALVMTQGDQDRRGFRVKGQEQRAGIMTQGKEDRKGLRVKGEEDRLGLRVSGEEDRLGMRVSGEEERAGLRTSGKQERMTIGAQGIQDRLLTKSKGREDRLGRREQGLQDRMLTQEKGSEDRRTQRDDYRQQRKMRADARGAIRRSGSRFFG